MAVNGRLLAASTIVIFFTVYSAALNSNNSCASSSCGDIRISYPFRLISSPKSCGYDDPSFDLECRNNRTILTSDSRRYAVKDINYDSYSIRLVDPSINAANLSSCPTLPNDYDAFSYVFTTGFFGKNVPVSFIYCLSPANSSKYVEGPFCGDRNRIFSNSSQIYSYVMEGEVTSAESDVEESCTVERVVWASERRGKSVNSSLAAIYGDLGYGIELTWFRALCGECEGYCSLEGNRINCEHSCFYSTPFYEASFGCKLAYYAVFIFAYGTIAIGAVIGLRFLIGFPFLIGLMVSQWKKRHLNILV